jgi:hypothetical protein
MFREYLLLPSSDHKISSLKMESAVSSEALVTTYRITHFHKPEGHIYKRSPRRVLYFYSSFVKSKYLFSTDLKHIPFPLFLNSERYKTKGLHLILYYSKLGISERKWYFHLSVSKLVSPEPFLRFHMFIRTLSVGSPQIQIYRRQSYLSLLTQTSQ